MMQTETTGRKRRRTILPVTLLVGGMAIAAGLMAARLQGYLGTRRFFARRGDPTIENLGLELDGDVWIPSDGGVGFHARRQGWGNTPWEFHGPIHAWRGDGSPCFAGRLADGRQVGPWTWWYDNGQVEQETDFPLPGQEDTIGQRWTCYHRNGVKRGEGTVDPFPRDVLHRSSVGCRLSDWRCWDHGGREIFRGDVPDQHPEYHLFGPDLLPWGERLGMDGYPDEIVNDVNTPFDLKPDTPFTIYLALHADGHDYTWPIVITAREITVTYALEGGYGRLRKPLDTAQRDLLIAHFNALQLGRLSNRYDNTRSSQRLNIGLSVFQDGRLNRTRFHNGWPVFLREFCHVLKNDLLRLRREDFVDRTIPGLGIDEDREYSRAVLGIFHAPYEGRPMEPPGP